MPITCPLCADRDSRAYHSDKKRDYYQCPRCDLVFVTAQQHLDQTAEKAEYDKHENSLQDAGYLNFLARTANPLCARLPAGAQGLDFGCGPAPALAMLLEQQGFKTRIYDLYYHNDKAALKQDYDFICSTEVIEHLSQPGAVLKQLWQRLKPGGIMALMTKRVKDLEAFKNWHYKNDPTHISFFSTNSFAWLAEHLAGELEVIDNDVVFLKKPERLT